MSLQTHLYSVFHRALVNLANDPAKYAAMVKPATDAKFGDYQANLAMPLAKELGKPPKDVAAEVIRRLDIGDVLEPPTVAGPGFINLRFRSDWLGKQLAALASDERLGVEKTDRPRTFVLDYSSPNVAKPLHVGHLRSTIIGNSLDRTLRFLGHRVIADNHLGDWGTQFGILLYGYKNFRDDAAYAADPVQELTRLYLHVRNLSKDAEEGDDPVADACRAETAKLHAGDAENLALWQQFMPHAMKEIEHIYRRLDVHFDEYHGESFYQPMLASVVEDFLAKGIARESQAAIGVFLSKDPEAPPALIRKRDGAFTYTTSDLACIRYRVQHYQADAMLYMVDARQALHFQNLFAAARLWGYTAVELNHVAFGSVLGTDRRPLKTRDGGTIELEALLDEAVDRARSTYATILAERIARGEEVPNLSDEDKQRIAEVVGIGAVKYADLCQHRTTDYVFAWDKLLAMDGNTAAYMQYAYARCRSIIRKSEVEPAELRNSSIAMNLGDPHERHLALRLLQFPETLNAVAAEYLPHLITAYLWDLAKTYSGFFTNCPVLKAPTPELRHQRLLLCDLTARTIQRCLDLLGIKVVERM